MKLCASAAAAPHTSASLSHRSSSFMFLHTNFCMASVPDSLPCAMICATFVKLLSKITAKRSNLSYLALPLPVSAMCFWVCALRAAQHPAFHGRCDASHRSLLALLPGMAKPVGHFSSTAHTNGVRSTSGFLADATKPYRMQLHSCVCEEEK